MCLLGMVAGRASLVCLLVGVLAWRAGLVGLVPKQGRDPNVSAHFRVAARICLGSVLGRHDRDPNMSTHIRIAAVLWDETIKSLCVCVYFCVNFVSGRGWDLHSACAPQARPRSECEHSHSDRGRALGRVWVRVNEINNGGESLGTGGG